VDVVYRSQCLRPGAGLVTQVLQRLSATEARVMVVDDDPQVLTHTELTRALGNQANNLEDPRRFWDILQNFSQIY